MLSNFFTYDGKEVLFSIWSPLFSPDDPQSLNLLEYPVWIQFLGLHQCLRNEKCLRVFASKQGKILFVEDSSSYANKAAGPRVKVVVPDYTNVQLGTR